MAAPHYDVDFYSDALIRDPHPHYAALRALGPVVWLPKNQAYALPRYDEVSHVLRNHAVYQSSRGVSLNPRVNELLIGSTLNSDPPRHDTTRAVTAAPLFPGALTSVEPRIRQAADRLIEELCDRGSFDAISDLATHLPLSIVAELVGLPDAGRDNMLRWASATFNLFADDNERAQASFDDLKHLREFLDVHGKPDALKPDGWARRIFDTGPDHGLDLATCAQLMRDYISPSLDTTISVTGQMIKLFADNPDQWQALLDDETRLGNAIEEAVRLSTPIRAFSRYVAKDTELAGHTLLEGSRVLVIYASANRDERKFSNPDQFDITRDVHDHLGFGHGVHMCMGMHLARLEIQSLLQALRRRVHRFETVGEISVVMNNTIRAFGTLPVKVHLHAVASRPGVETGSEQPPASNASGLSPAESSLDWLTVRIESVTRVANDILAIEFSGVGSTLPAFTAGAHIDVEVMPGLVRQYSLCNPPGDSSGRYRIAVLRTATSSGGSVGVHERFRSGAQVRIGAPRNLFPLQDGQRHCVLLAGGIGITPLLSMAHALSAVNRSFELHYAARHDAAVAFRDELKGFGDRVVIHLDNGDVDQRLNLNALLSTGQHSNELYLCGPTGFMDAVVRTARQHGWPDDAILLERFGAEIDTDGEPFTVIAQRSQQRIEIQPGETIAGKLKALGVPVRMSCQSGVCGTCLTPVLGGTPDHRDLVQTDREKASNQNMTICCSRSRSRELILDI